MIKIGGASGYWGDSAMSTPQLIDGGANVLVYDYLAEITMSILARARQKDPDLGYATDFVTGAMAPNLEAIAERKIRVVSNAGGINPVACGAALREVIAAKGLGLGVAVVTGDDLMPKLDEIAEMDPHDLGDESPFPEPSRMVSMNAYIGAQAIASALQAVADIVITGRCVDSALTLGALMAEYGWRPDDLDLVAAGSLIGHLLECGPQVTGGNFTDWREVPARDRIGYPIAEVERDGTAVITKAQGTGGLVTKGTVTEQLLYELGDPGTYTLPDVTCDFRHVTVAQVGENRVLVSGAKGLTPPTTLKICATVFDGWRGGLTASFYGFEAADKARHFADTVIARAEAALRAKSKPPYSEKSIEVLGSGDQLGEHLDTNEVVLKLAVRHPDESAVGLMLRESAGMGLAAPPGLCGFIGGKPRPSPVVKLFSFLLDRDHVTLEIDLGDGKVEPFKDQTSRELASPKSVMEPGFSDDDDLVEVPLVKLAWARSGDKGNDANVGVIAREPEMLPYIWHGLTKDVLTERFGHVLEDGSVERYFMPGPGAVNVVLKQSLGGGGVASLRADPQGKGFSQILLRTPIRIPRAMADKL